MGSIMKLRGALPKTGWYPINLNFPVDGFTENIVIVFSSPLLEAYKNLPSGDTKISALPITPLNASGWVGSSCIAFSLPLL